MNSTLWSKGLIPGETIVSNVKGTCVFIGWTKGGRIRFRQADGKVTNGYAVWFFQG